jgi:molybdate-binding protein
MVRGLNVFKQYFEQHPNSYVIIGGTACDIIIDEAGFVPRTTKDIDIILVVEALSSDFVKQFWQFIHDGNYRQREKSNNQREYDRFIQPQNSDFPQQIELFSRTPDMIVLEADAHLAPIPVDDDLSSLSAILLNEDYYNYMIQHSQVEGGLHHANIEALICLKAKAYLEIKERIEMGSKEDAKQLKKHKADVFRLTVLLAPASIFELPNTIQTHINQFAALVSGALPDKAIFKEMGLANVDPNNVFEQFKKSFRVNFVEG